MQPIWPFNFSLCVLNYMYIWVWNDRCLSITSEDEHVNLLGLCNTAEEIELTNQEDIKILNGKYCKEISWNRNR